MLMYCLQNKKSKVLSHPALGDNIVQVKRNVSLLATDDDKKVNLDRLEYFLTQRLVAVGEFDTVAGIIDNKFKVICDFKKLVPAEWLKELKGKKKNAKV